MSDYTEKTIEWFRSMVKVYKEVLTPEEKADLHEWEKENLGRPKGLSTTEWPGWEKHIGSPPWDT